MDSAKNIPDELLEAFTIFVHDLEHNLLPSLDRAIRTVRDLEKIGQEHVHEYYVSNGRQLEQLFHRIKGGGGLLNLDFTVDLAKKCEKLFKGERPRLHNPTKITEALILASKILHKQHKQLDNQLTSRIS